MMKFSKLCAILERHEPSCRFCIAFPDLGISEVRYSDSEQHYLQSVIYIVPKCGEESLSRHLCNFVSIDSKPTDGAYNAIFAPDELTFARVCNILFTVLSDDSLFSGTLRDVLSGSTTLQNIVDGIAVKINNPLMIESPTYKILAMSDHDSEHRSWQSALRSGYVPNAYRPDAGFQDFLANIGRKPEAWIGRLPGSHQRRIIVPLLWNGALIGYADAWRHYGEFDDEDIEFITQMSVIVTMELVRQNMVKLGAETPPSYFLADLISGEISGTLVDECAAEYGMKDFEFYYLLYVRWSGDRRDHDMLDAATSRLLARVPKSITTIIDNDVVILIGWDKAQDESGMFEYFRSVLVQRDAAAVISGRYSDLTSTGEQYGKIKALFEMHQNRNNSETFIRLNENSDKALIASYGKKHSLEDLVSPAVQAVMDYDDEHGTDFMDCISEYIRSGRNYSAAAEKLFTHRNTLIYRIKRISELVNYDFQNEPSVFSVELSLRILDYLKDNK